MRALSILVLAFACANALAAPPEALAVALAHARTLPADPARRPRYLDLTHLTPDSRADALKVLSFHLNALSRESDLSALTALNGGAVVYFDLRDFGLDPFVYGRLGSVEAAEPYYHVTLEYVEAGKRQKKTAPAPWLDPAQVEELYRLCDSQVPLLRADWFVYQTAVAKDRVAGYYDQLGLGKKEADFQRLIGANPAESKRLKMELAASVADSTVALHNRGLSRLQSLTGGHWLTLDYKTSTNKQNTARLLAGDTEPPQGDASEQFGVLPNRLFAYWLQDAQGNRQDTAPDDIASDGRSTSTDRRVHAMLSCVRCHVEGLRPVDDYARRIFRGPLALVSPDFARLKRLRQLYLTDLPAQLAEDNARYAGALRAVNGLEPAANARLYSWFWEAYADTPVAAEAAARELGVTEAALLSKVRAHVARQKIADPVVAAYAQVPPAAIRRDHFHEVYPNLQLLLKE